MHNPVRTEPHAKQSDIGFREAKPGNEVQYIGGLFKEPQHLVGANRCTTGRYSKPVYDNAPYTKEAS